MKFLEYLFCKYYNFQVRVGNADVAPFSSMLIISFVLMLYYFDFFIALSVLFPKSSPNLVWEVNAIVLLSIIIFFYFLMIHKGKYKVILKRNYAQDKSSLFAILFPLIAFLLFNLGFILKMLQNLGKK
jgi:hypothetical protein